MDGLSRRELLKRSAVVGGVVWAAPMISSGTAWGQSATPCCNCEGGEVIYAKFAPGNSQTCQNQCLQPNVFGVVHRYSVECLVEQGLLGLCDDVSSNASTASIAFGDGVTPFKFAIKTTDDCFVSRCNEGFSKIFRWVASTNAEIYTAGSTFTDPAGANDDAALFQVYTGGTGPASTRCTGNQAGSHRPAGTRCGSSNGKTCPCTTPITGMFMTTDALGTTLNFIEMELCVTNASKINCTVTTCA
jgi:hypothetical protein